MDGSDQCAPAGGDADHNIRSPCLRVRRDGDAGCDNRDLGIEVRDENIVDRLNKVAEHDWQHSHPLDLSDAGLLADLEGRVEGSAEILAIDTKRGDTNR